MPKEKLLEFKAQQGWKPLCDFLEKPIPDEPFPRINEGNNTVEIHYFIFWFRVIALAAKSAKIILPVLIALVAAWLYRDHLLR